jgi:hypothetical protein
MKLLQINASDSTRTKAETLQRFLGEHYFHPDSGIMYAMWRWKGAELRPFRAEDFDGMSLFRIKAGIAMEDHQNQENSPWTSGLFLLSQCLRFKVTKEDEALRYAAKAFLSLEVIYDMGGANNERGLLCKPYGNRFSHETSPDQYVSVLLALWSYREMVDAATRARIDEMMVEMSDWWRLRNYKLVYFDHEGDWFSGVAVQQYGPLYAMMHEMAHRISGRDEYRKEAERCIEKCGSFAWRHDIAREEMLATGKTNWPASLHGYEYDPSRRPFLHFNWENLSAIWLAAASAAWLMENLDSPLRHTLKHAIGNYFRWMSRALNDDLLFPYWSQTDLETEKTYPLVRPRTSTNRKDYIIDFDWNFFAYASKVGWGDPAARLVDLGVIAHHLSPGFSPGALSLSKAMLARIDDERLKWFIDPDGKHFMPEDAWMAHVMSSEVPSFTVLTYWRAKTLGIDLETQSA